MGPNGLCYLVIMVDRDPRKHVQCWRALKIISAVAPIYGQALGDRESR